MHRRKDLGGAITRQGGIPVTNPVFTLVDLATCIDRIELEAAVNEADKVDLVTPEELRTALGEIGRRPGAKLLRDLLDRQTFTLTDSELERLFLRIVRRANMPPPATRVWLNGYKVDFYWPAFGLVVETDGLRYHRTAAQQLEDRRRDQAHAAAGLSTLRFTHAQVRFHPNHVQATLEAVIRIRP